MTRKLVLVALAAAAALGLTGCRLHPSSPGFLPDGSSVWIFDVDKDDGTTVRTWIAAYSPWLSRRGGRCCGRWCPWSKSNDRCTYWRSTRSGRGRRKASNSISPCWFN